MTSSLGRIDRHPLYAATVFESRYVRNGRGAPGDIVPPLKAQSGQTGKGDGAPLVTYSIVPESGQGADLRASETDVSPALASTDRAKQTDRGARIASTAGVRRLTPLECERLQGFPDGWTDMGPDSRRYSALGDAVTVNVIEWIGRRLAG